MAVPVTLLTGYLGAGKTTLLNRLLTVDHGLRIAVIVNEFGEIGIDGDLVVNVEEEIITLANGCICCTLREDLIEAVESIIDGSNRPDHLLVETSGVGDPSATVMTFLSHPDAGERFTLDGVVTVVDALNLRRQLERSPEVRAQIAMADRILLNKIDLAPAEQLEELEQLIATINPAATVERTIHAETDLYEMLDIRTFDSSRVVEGMAKGSDYGASVPRMLTSSDHRTPALPQAGVPMGEHESGIAAVSIAIDGDLDLETFDRWVESLLDSRHEDLYRLKGIIALAGSPRRYIIQAVHALSTWQYGAEWDDAPRRSRLVLIGRGLDRSTIESQLEACRTRR